MIAFGSLATLAFLTFAFFYFRYARMIDDKLSIGPFAATAQLFAAPEALNVGDEITATDVAARLRRAGYTENRSNPLGAYRLTSNSIEIYPGPQSYFQDEAGLLRFSGNSIRQIVSLRDNTARTSYLMEPELVTNLFDKNREKRRMVKYNDIPKVMVEALLSAEDKRFFDHSGFDYFRMAKAMMENLKPGGNLQGASTLTMQLAGSLWLDRSDRTWKRKLPEMLMTLHLEHKLTKEEIFEHYANQIYLGNVGSFSVNGFGEGAQSYFGKNLSQLNAPEAALLAGIIQNPSRFNPFRHADRATQRRNIILRLMRDNGYVDEAAYQKGIAAPLTVTQGAAQSDDAPFFVDLVNSKLVDQFQDHDFQNGSYRIYTTLDLNLQREASAAVQEGLVEVDKLLTKAGRTPEKGWPPVQVALVTLDAHTGEVKAMIGGRRYGTSQLNRALAHRPPGSIFKPFVYAAVIQAGAHGEGDRAITPATTVVDEPTTFFYGGEPYEPNNFGGKFNGTVNMRQALTRSLNVPTIKYAEMAGYRSVVRVARAAGMNKDIRATPSVALGSYDVQPLEIAGAYTIFPNNGTFHEPAVVKVIRDQTGHTIFTAKPAPKYAIDPKAAYIVTNMMEDNMNYGTAAGVRSRGFRLPAAGKTGTDNDAWFAGFTSELITVVWVGYDDYRDIKMEGAKAALPIWTAFMKRAHNLRPYKRAHGFVMPDGIVSVSIDRTTGKRSSPACAADARTELFIAGSEPLETCDGQQPTEVSSWTDEATEEANKVALAGGAPVAPPVNARPNVTSRPSIPRPTAPSSKPRTKSEPKSVDIPTPESNQPEADKPKKGIFGRLGDIFR
jgi:penicillin-binding protein 1B